MILLGGPEFDGRDDLGDDGPRKARLGSIARGLGFGLLLGGMIEDRGTVLRTDVRALAIERGRVVIVPEDLKQVVVADDGGIEGDFEALGVSGAPRAHVFVRGLRERSSGVAYLRG